MASLCYPSGIKICYSQTEEIPKDDFLIINTALDGSKYYIATYHFYVKIPLSDFSKIYKRNAIHDFLNIEKVSAKDDAEGVAEIETKLELITDFNFRDFVHVPVCACLLSECPFATQMETCLKHLIQGKQLKHLNKSILDRIILQITTQVTVPPKDSKLLYKMPGKKDQIEIFGLVQNELPITNFNLLILLDLFAEDELFLLLRLLFLEQKVLIVAETSRILPIICESLLSILYPFTWTCAFIPVVTESLVKYLQTPMPFLMGIDKNMFEFVGEFIDEEEGITVFNLAEKRIYLSNKAKMCTLLKEVPDLPKRFKSTVRKGIKEANTARENKNSNASSILRRAFIEGIIGLLAFYDKFTTKEEEISVFDAAGFLECREEESAFFLKELVETQTFNFFLQFEVETEFPLFYQAYSFGMEDTQINMKSVAERLKMPNENEKTVFYIPDEFEMVEEFETTRKTCILEEKIEISPQEEVKYIYSFQERTRSSYSNKTMTMVEEEVFEMQRDRRILSKIHKGKQKRENSLLQCK